MPRMQLSLATLGEFDFGKAAVAFQKELQKVVIDMIDRPGDDRPRTVTLKTSLKPLVQQEGDVVDSQVEFEITSSMPSRRTKPRPAMIDRRGNLLFSADAPDNPRQETFEMGGEGSD